MVSSSLTKSANLSVILVLFVMNIGWQIHIMLQYGPKPSKLIKKITKKTPLPNIMFDRTNVRYSWETIKKMPKQIPASMIQVYEPSAKKFQFYKSIHDMGRRHFADMINKHVGQYVIAETKANRTQNELQRYFIFSENTKIKNDGDVIFESPFWIVINRQDLIVLIQSLGYVLQNGQISNNLLFRRQLN